MLPEMKVLTIVAHSHVNNLYAGLMDMLTSEDNAYAFPSTPLLPRTNIKASKRSARR